MKNNNRFAWFLRVSLIAISFFGLQNVVSAQLKETPKEEIETPAPEPKAKKGKKTSTKKTSKSKTSTTKTDEYFDEKGEWKNKIQYGINLNPNILSFGGGTFNICIDPMVGYKFNNWAMAGIIGGIDYSYLSYEIALNTRIVAQPINFSYGVYGRAKVFESIYVHSDFRQATYTRPRNAINPDNPKRLLTESINKPELNVGLAYRTGGSGWGYEFSATYNALYNDTYIDWKQPFDIKLGFTYNF